MRVFLFILSIVLVVSFYLCPTRLKAQGSYSELDRSDAFSSSRTTSQNTAEVIQINDLIIYSDAGRFNQICGSLLLENFASTNVPPDSIDVCPSPFDSSTNNNCFAQGALIDGFSLTGIPVQGIGDLVVITPPFEGIADVLVGPDDFLDDSDITFQDGGAQAVGLFIYTLAAEITNVNLEIHGPGDLLLGSTSLITSPNGLFFGVISTNGPITHITFTNGYGELFTNLSFGNCTLAKNIPTMSEWGLIALAGILGLAAILVMNRRKVNI